MTAITKTVTWKGEYTFLLSGSGLHEDTLRIRSNYRKQEQLLKLIIPTLCITYADAKFQDSIGGEQLNFPASKGYGPAYFNPPVKILGEKEIERFTYIRGAQRIEIGPMETVIEFPSWKELVIPRLRLDQKKSGIAQLVVPDTQIQLNEPLQISVLQYADGRHVGGVRMEKRHPEWKVPEPKELYNLWLRVIDGITLQPLPKVLVHILHWNPNTSTPFGIGGFDLDDRRYTDENGCILAPDRPSGELEAYVVYKPDSRAVVRCLRPMAGQNVRLHMRVWPLKRDEKQVDLQSYEATYHMEPWDTFDWMGKSFGYKNAIGLAKVNSLNSVEDLEKLIEIKLPDWHFFYAQENDTLEKFDKMFHLPKGSSISVGRVYHPDPRIPYTYETIAVPTLHFVERVRKVDQ